ncbi:hypothetical protein NDU88_000662 [Pleurodeles waltl]|uniref:Uncharacterized protein n=1 Tax=Pleurodeles waltl TaxID=8319 RepID=A0AAV7VX90_PLEWA|nr:hypothetical protein NDU88_000662 [Pleurodeles waltl]
MRVIGTYLKTFRHKSVSGRKVRISPKRIVGGAPEVSQDLPVIKMQAPWGGVKFVRRSGASFQQRVVSRGRGATGQSAMAGVGRLGVRPGGAHARSDTHALRQSRNQALLPSENSGEREERALEERHLGGGARWWRPLEKVRNPLSLFQMRKVKDKGNK